MQKQLICGFICYLYILWCVIKDQFVVLLEQLKSVLRSSQYLQICLIFFCLSPDEDEDDDDDEDITPEAKAQREKVRRQQNNARERWAFF